MAIYWQYAGEGYSHGWQRVHWLTVLNHFVRFNFVVTKVDVQCNRLEDGRIVGEAEFILAGPCGTEHELVFCFALNSVCRVTIRIAHLEDGDIKSRITRVTEFMITELRLVERTRAPCVVIANHPTKLIGYIGGNIKTRRTLKGHASTIPNAIK